MTSQHARSMRTCNVCGTPLARGENCHCTSAVTKGDGMRANCVGFIHRSGYRGMFYIECRAPGGNVVKRAYSTREERDWAYKTYCCQHGGGCDISRK